MDSTSTSALSGFLLYLQKERHHHRHRTDQALSAIYTAANETQYYLEEYRRKGRRNRSIERRLSRFWSNAAIACRGVDEDFADRSLLKHQIWKRPEIWKKEYARVLGVDLDQIFADARKLLHRKSNFPPIIGRRRTR
jgi:hypothetical protein